MTGSRIPSTRWRIPGVEPRRGGSQPASRGLLEPVRRGDPGRALEQGGAQRPDTAAARVLCGGLDQVGRLGVRSVGGATQVERAFLVVGGGPGEGLMHGPAQARIGVVVGDMGHEWVDGSHVSARDRQQVRDRRGSDRVGEHVVGSLGPRALEPPGRTVGRGTDEHQCLA